MPAGGHVQEYANGQQASPEEAAFRELDEELFSGKLGLAVQDALRDGKLIPVGDPYSSLTDEPDRTPPFLDREIRQLYAGSLTEFGLAQMQPDEEELSGVLMCSPVQAWEALEWPSIAPGARVSLPRYLRWLQR